MEPGELAFGVVDAVKVEFFAHGFLVDGLSQEPGNPAVFEAKDFKTFPGDALVVKSPNLLNHTLVKTLIEAFFYFCAEFFDGRIECDDLRSKE